MQLAIKNAKLLQNDKEVIRNIYVENGEIKEISAKEKKAKKTIDAKNNFVIPGLIDCHVHCREPGAPYKEDFFTISKAAAAGGVTTILDMPNNNPPTNTVKELERKRKLAKKCIVNYGFHFGTGNLGEIKKAKNIASVKIYMNETTGNYIEHDPMYFNSFRRISVHAEGDTIKKALKYCRKRLYWCHLSLENEVKMLPKKNVYAEVCPQHLFLTNNDGFSMKPCLKTKKDQKALWKAVQQGKIHTICTDHAPHLKKENAYGVTGLETMLPLLLDSVNKGRLSLQQMVTMTSSNPAAIFGIRHKGRIAVGYDADVVIINMKKVKKIKNSKLFTKCGWSPFDGRTLKGWPVMTIVNGNIVYHNGRITNVRAKEVVFA